VTDPVDPVRRAERTARINRRADANGAADRPTAGANLPVPVGSPYTRPRDPAGSDRTASGKASPVVDAAFSAQLMAGTPRRGLKGGPETLDQARSTYLGTEYSGKNDRRPKPGRSTRTEV
jgi:hypothetical protein